LLRTNLKEMRMKMAKENILLKGRNISLRLISTDDTEQYYKTGFETEDEEIMRLTGTKRNWTKEEIISYVNRIVKDDTRYDFLILNSKDEIIGESVINQIDSDIRCAGFRIALFHSDNCGLGIGSEAIRLTVKFGFEELNLHRIELEVYPFNERAYKAYRRAGFSEEGRKRDAEFIDGRYWDVIIMGILESEYGTVDI
jgi:RimJ/RimL family protein N-acetyltransferase